MSLKRVILELGTGNDLYGEDYTKAAKRAVHDALHHSSITLFRSLGIDRESMVVNVVVGVQKPEAVDCDAVATELPHGSVTVTAEMGGLNLVDDDNGTVSVIATVGVSAYLDLPDEKFVLK